MSIDDIVARRMTNTGESYPEAFTAIMKSVLDVEADAVGGYDVGWVKEWTDPGPWEPEVPGEAEAWMRGRPESLHALMAKFPPSSVVRPLVPLQIPRRGTFGVVRSYVEPDEHYPDGQIGVTAGPSGLVRAQCDPGDLEVVGYWRGWTPDRVREVLRQGTSKPGG